MKQIYELTWKTATAENGGYMEDLDEITEYLFNKEALEKEVGGIKYDIENFIKCGDETELEIKLNIKKHSMFFANDIEMEDDEDGTE